MKTTAFLRRHHRPIMLFAALYLCGAALWNMAKTCRYVYEAQVVEGVVDDWRKVPVESLLELWCTGNFSLGADTCYQPVVRFTLPNGAVMSRLMPDMDCIPYELGQKVAVLTLPRDPAQTRLYQVRHLWGGDALVLLLGLGTLAYSLAGLRKQRKTVQEPAASFKRSHPAPSRSNDARRPKRQRKKTSPLPQQKAQDATASPPQKKARKKKQGNPESST